MKEKNVNQGNFYKINVIKAEENNDKKVDENNEKKDKFISKSLRRMKSINDTKNILENSLRIKKGSVKSTNNEQIKKSLFANVRKTNINFFNNKTKIFQDDSISPKKRKINYNRNNNDYAFNLIKLTNQLYENVEHLKKKINPLINDINESEFLTPKFKKNDKLLKIENIRKSWKKKKQKSSHNLNINLYEKNDIIKNINSKEEQNEKKTDKKLLNINNKYAPNSSKFSLFFVEDKINANNNKNLELKLNSSKKSNVFKLADKQANGNKKIFDNNKIKEIGKNNDDSVVKNNKIISYNNYMENERNAKSIISNNKSIEKQISNKKIDVNNNENIEKRTNDYNKIFDNNEIIEKDKNDKFIEINNTKKKYKLINIKKCFFCCCLSPKFNNND